MPDPRRSADAIDIALRVNKLADDTLAPLLREFNRLGWPADFRAIVLRAVANKATRLASAPDA